MSQTANFTEKMKGSIASDHEQGCNSQKNMHQPHLPTYCDHSQSFARFYFWGTAIPSHFPPWHHLMSQTANFWKKWWVLWPQIMNKCAIPKKACINLIFQFILTIHKVLQGFTCGEQPWHQIFHHGITSCHKQPIFAKNEGIQGLRSWTGVQISY